MTVTSIGPTSRSSAFVCGLLTPSRSGARCVPLSAATSRAGTRSEVSEYKLRINARPQESLNKTSWRLLVRRKFCTRNRFLNGAASGRIYPSSIKFRKRCLTATKHAASRRVRTMSRWAEGFMKPTQADANRVYNRRYERPKTEIQ